MAMLFCLSERRVFTPIMPGVRSLRIAELLPHAVSATAEAPRTSNIPIRVNLLDITYSMELRVIVVPT